MEKKSMVIFQLLENRLLNKTLNGGCISSNLIRNLKKKEKWHETDFVLFNFELAIKLFLKKKCLHVLVHSCIGYLGCRPVSPPPNMLASEIIVLLIKRELFCLRRKTFPCLNWRSMIQRSSWSFFSLLSTSTACSNPVIQFKHCILLNASALC